MNFFRKEPTVKEQQRQNDRELRKAGRDLERDKLALEREEKKLEMEIKKIAKEGNNEGCKMLAKQLVQMRKQKTRLYTANSKVKGKPLSKDEVKALLQLIEMSSIITNKTMNATTNKLKLDEWKRITDKFNNTASICRRSPRQLRLKWENLKKNSRKRSMKIQANQSSDGAQDYIPCDDILDRVAKLLSSTVRSATIPFRGDKELDEHANGIEVGVHVSSCDGSGDEFVLGDARIQNGDQTLGSQDEPQHNGENIHAWAIFNVQESSRFIINVDILSSTISSVQIQNKAMGANVALAGAMGTTAKTMGSMNKIMNPHQIAKDMEAFKQASLKMDMTDDMISDTLDDIMTESGDEEETEGIVNQVLDEIGIEVSGKIANAPSVSGNKVGASTSDIDKELMAQLTKLKS